MLGLGVRVMVSALGFRIRVRTERISIKDGNKNSRLSCSQA